MNQGEHLEQLEAFPADFVWGAATSAYQIEGAVSADGRGESIWDVFARRPGRILGGHHGELAADSYRRTDQDVDVMAELGLRAYRFSVSWPRIVPDGRGAVNTRGLDHYERFVDLLLERGVEPWITLYHWDLPQALEEAGGWPDRDTADRFAEYAAAVHGRLSDRVRHWITVNEPWCAAFLGYASGEHAPGRREPAASLAAAHHLLLGHGRAVQAMRAQSGETRIAPGLNFYPVRPAGDDPADRDAVRRIDGMQNRLMADAVLAGGYPDDVLEDMRKTTPLDFIKDGDDKIIAQPVDLLCVNYYSRFTVTAAGAEGSGSAAAAPVDVGSPWPGNEEVRFVSSGLPVTDMGWEIDPSGLTGTLRRLAADYPGVDLAVTENGAAYPDHVVGGRVDDLERRRYLTEHVAACAEALRGGAPLRAYFVWSLLDNFEWAWGYGKRFGIVHVDFETQRRTVKDSGRWYADLIRRHADRTAAA